MELKGTRGLFDTVKSSRTWSVATVFLRLGVSRGFGGQIRVKPEAMGRGNGQNGTVTCCCCLLAKFKGRGV